MKIFRLLIILTLAFFNIYSFASNDVQITIFVHGTRRLSKLFLTYTNKDNKITNIKEIPSSYITHSISKSLSKADSKNFAKECFYVFGWSGNLSHQARLEAAKILYDEILQLIKVLKKQNINPIINLITHSHGGNVALNLAVFDNQKDNNPKFQINNLILLACPIQEQTHKLVNHKLFKNVYNIYSTLDLIQILDPQGMHPENKGKKVPLFSQRIFDFCPKLKQAEIKINNYGIGHASFLSSKFCKRLPKILNKMKQLPCNSLHLIKV